MSSSDDSESDLSAEEERLARQRSMAINADGDSDGDPPKASQSDDDDDDNAVVVNVIGEDAESVATVGSESGSLGSDDSDFEQTPAHKRKRDDSGGGSSKRPRAGAGAGAGAGGAGHAMTKALALLQDDDDNEDILVNAYSVPLQQSASVQAARRKIEVARNAERAMKQRTQRDLAQAQILEQSMKREAIRQAEYNRQVAEEKANRNVAARQQTFVAPVEYVDVVVDFGEVGQRSFTLSKTGSFVKLFRQFRRSFPHHAKTEVEWTYGDRVIREFDTMQGIPGFLSNPTIKVRALKSATEEQEGFHMVIRFEGKEEQYPMGPTEPFSVIMDKFCADHGVSRSEVRFIDADGDDEVDPGLAPTDDAYDYEGGEVLDVSRL